MKAEFLEKRQATDDAEKPLVGHYYPDELGGMLYKCREQFADVFLENSTALFFCMQPGEAEKMSQQNATPTPPSTSSKRLTPTSCPAILHYKFNRLQDGASQDLCQYAGKVILVVNTASFCGFTKQYEGLEALYAKY